MTLPDAAQDVVLHASADSGDGRTLCGDVHEGDPTLDLPAPVEAAPGQRVTCEPCLRVIQYVHAFFTPGGKAK